MVQARLIEAASAKETKKAALVERLYVPEPYYRERAQEIDGRRMKQLQPYMPTSANKTEMLIYVGELKNIEPSRFGSKLVIKHAPSFPIFMDEKMEKSVRKRFALEFDLAEAHEQLKLVMIATVGLNRAASAQLAEVSIMLVNENWIPVESLSELQLIDHLTADKRSFTKTLRFNVKERPIASALLTDTTPVCAMYIQPEEAGAALINLCRHERRDIEFPRKTVADHASVEAYLIEKGTHTIGALPRITEIGLDCHLFAD